MRIGIHASTPDTAQVVQLCREVGVVVAGAVLISSFVALTLSPMLCRFILKHERRHSRFHQWTEPFFRRLTEAYRRSLGAFLRRRWLSWPLLSLIHISEPTRPY